MNLNIAVLFGGNSVEHEISIISAVQAMHAMDRSRYQVIPIYLSKEHRFYQGESLMDIEAYRDITKLLNEVDEVMFKRHHKGIFLSSVKSKLFKKDQSVDMVLPILHGTYSEDGTVVGFLETLGIPYVGSDVIASAIGQDKVFMKIAFEHAKLPIIPWFYGVEEDHQQDPQYFERQAQALGYPVIVKPARLGSSIGIKLVNSDTELHEALEVAFKYDRKCVIEKAIVDLREVNCSVLGDEHGLKASVLEEVAKQDEILSYEDKYQSGSKSKGMASLNRIIPAKLSAQETLDIQQMAMKAFKLLNNRGVARIDFIIDQSQQKLYINEINTIPGSLSFYLWEKSGLSFQALLDALIQQGIDLQRTRAKRITSFETNVLSNLKLNRKQGKL
jgi:D-alanine-D-alanine ligase